MKPYRQHPAFEPAPGRRITLAGEVGRRLEAVTTQWILPTPSANPAILEMFRDRDRKPPRQQVAWAGEFAGKYLTHAVQIYRLTRDAKLKDHVEWFVRELISLQADDGYLGPWPKKWRLTGQAPAAGNRPSDKRVITWDAWGHYHIMLGLLLWHDLTADAKALRCVRRMADLFCRMFLDSGRRLASTGSTEMNLAPIHALCLLHRKSGEGRYLAMARQIEADFADPDAGDYIRTALAGREFFETPKPRWESLHAIQGIAELYFLTGRPEYRRAFEHIWWSIVKLDRHNNGGFSSGERAQGNPYHPGGIETCCTIAWMAASIDMLRMTGESVVADELELSTLNSGLGMMSPSGRWVTYNTPMDGTRTASPTDATAFQARPGQPELNCCSVNGPRALGMIDDWALMADADGLAINYYGPCTMAATVAGREVIIEQRTDYPASGRVELCIRSQRPAECCLKLRIPYWSARTTVAVNGQSAGRAGRAEYLAIEGKWRAGDTIRLNLDMSLHYWSGQKQCRRKTSIYRGPVLLTYDPQFNEMDADDLPELDAAGLTARKARAKSWLPPWMLWELPAADGRKLRLCDYASAGAAGRAYKSWLKVRGAPSARFSRANPLRSARP